MISSRKALASLVPILLLAGCNSRPVGLNQQSAPSHDIASAKAPARTQAALAESGSAETAATAASAAGDHSTFSVVRDRSQVCMVNDQYMGREQIPVTVEGKTYYGCCSMCKGRLERDAKTRAAEDPVTRRPVDKATALIARGPSGNVLYFESEQTFAQFRL